MSKSIALIGNPNCGKTTLFNRLTGAKQWIGNWPGVTVEQHHGAYIAADYTIVNVIDLPGCYSLVATQDMALDERITCEYIASTQNVLYVNVVDAAHLSRDLYLSLQLLESGVPVIVAINCMDLAQVAGLKLNIELLAQQLGCPVVPIIAKNGSGLAELKAVISQDAIQNNFQISCPPVLQSIIELWQPYTNAGQSLRVLEGDVLLTDKLRGIAVAQARATLQQNLQEQLDIYIAQWRRQKVKQILQQVLVKTKVKSNLSEKIDNVVLHKVFGPLIFLGVMYSMFTCAINLGGFLQIWFERSSEAIFVNGTHYILLNTGAPLWLANMLTEGLGRGISITLTFAPVLSAMFLCLGILEGTGYMTRAAFIVDRLMRYMGLSGRAFVPMIVGFGCNVPAVLGTRSLPSQRERILTIMMTPFMSCSARLAIYAIFVAAFFPIGGQNVIFSLYMIGIIVAVLTALALRNSVSDQTESMSVMEMSDYRWPMFSSLFRQAWQRLKSFLLKAGVLIIVLCILINGLGNDVLANIGKFLTPLFGPIGISPENWPATVGLFTGLIAKEAVVGTLGAFYANDAAMVQSFGGVIPAYAYLLFTLLYFPCVSVVAAISKELNFKWAMFSVVWSTGLAYLIAALFYQIATLNSWLWIISLLSILLGFFAAGRWLVRQEQARVARRKMLPTMVIATN